MIKFSTVDRLLVSKVELREEVATVEDRKRRIHKLARGERWPLIMWKEDDP